MQLQLTFSSTVSTIGYDVEFLELTIGFLEGGTYIYLGVPLKTYWDLLKGLDKDEHIYSFIKNYPYKPGVTFDTKVC